MFIFYKKPWGVEREGKGLRGSLGDRHSEEDPRARVQDFAPVRTVREGQANQGRAGATIISLLMDKIYNWATGSHNPKDSCFDIRECSQEKNLRNLNIRIFRKYTTWRAPWYIGLTAILQKAGKGARICTCTSDCQLRDISATRLTLRTQSPFVWRTLLAMGAAGPPPRRTLCLEEVPSPSMSPWAACPPCWPPPAHGL